MEILIESWHTHKKDRDYLYLNEREQVLQEITDRQWLPYPEDKSIVHVLTSRDKQGKMIRTEYWMSGGETRPSLRTERDVLNKLDTIDVAVANAFSKACRPTKEEDIARIAEIQYTIELAIQQDDSEMLAAAELALELNELDDVIGLDDIRVSYDSLYQDLPSRGRIALDSIPDSQYDGGDMMLRIRTLS